MVVAVWESSALPTTLSRRPNSVPHKLVEDLDWRWSMRKTPLGKFFLNSFNQSRERKILSIFFFTGVSLKILFTSVIYEYS
jgi:hypothetical protein